MDRRQFIKVGGILLVGGAGAWCFSAGMGGGPSYEAVPSRRWGMAIDLTKCIPSCDACMKACRKENNVAFHGDEKWDVHWIRKVFIKSEAVADAQEKPVVLMCNHCDKPPCVQVCPVRATYRRDDGIVIVDPHRCMGCRYCMVACPYNARFFNYKESAAKPNKSRPKRSHGVAESCNFCAHLVDVGKRPACVEACGAKAMIFGDLNDPKSAVSEFAAAPGVKRIREDLGLAPKVYYLGF